MQLAAVRPVDVPAKPPMWVGNTLIARMDTRADLADVAAMPRGAARRTAAYEALVATARATQGAAIAALKPLQDAGIVTSVESMFLPNALVVQTVQGQQQSVHDALAGVAHVESVTQATQWSNPSTPPVDVPARAVGAATWGIERVGAPAAWAQGATGQGVTIGIIDTGLDADHEAIRAAYRGTQPDGSQQHDYNWFDGIEGTLVPGDVRGHGTHVAGSLVGATATSSIGVAPGAKLIAARAINAGGSNTTNGTLFALQWMLAPTKLDGTAPDPARGVDVLNNSWGTANGRDTFYLESYEGLAAAGIEIVTAAGNSGPEPGTISAPASYPGFLAAAATDARDEVMFSSSRGPSKLQPPAEPGQPRTWNPGIAAPGERIISAKAGGGFASRSGTSMAAPLVAGAMSVLLSAVPTATHAQLLDALTASVVDIDAPGPDDAAGYGRLDIPAALAHLRAATATP